MAYDYTWSDFVGNIGVALLVITYAGLQFGKLDAKGFWYSFNNLMVAVLLGINLSDSLTGFFITERKLLLQNKKKLYLNGYKIFLDFYLCKNVDINHKEIPIKLNERMYGKSKLTINTLLNIVRLILFKKLN